MSSDNAWYVKGSNVYMVDVSHFGELMRRAEERAEASYKARLAKRRPYHATDSHEAAVKWASDEYSEYGTYWVDEV